MRTLARQSTYHEEIKKSRFYATAAPVDSVEQALTFVEQVSDPEAGHNCWAYQVGHEYRFNDDGEPGGSAGRPILSAIEGKDLDHVCVVVSRVFGGIKLGVGGLIRAYGGTAARCLQTAPIKTIVPQRELRIFVPFACLNEVYVLLERFTGEKVSEAFETGGVQLGVVLATDSIDHFSEQLADRTAGMAVVRVKE